MRLLSVDKLEAVDFMPNQIPPYAILSHTWGDQEVSYEDLVNTNKSWQRKSGWQKIRDFARIAGNNGYRYIWCDTCCIDKRSSAELQEAINSMFRWYRHSQVCYAYLSDVSVTSNIEKSYFRSARWFCRGWTLQELLAPKRLVFYDREWHYIADKTALLKLLEDITGIKHRYLSSPAMITGASVAERMSWAAGRQTTREEDLAYCLLGIFDIHMPMLYGEGKNAFTRLQEKIMKVNEDSTLLAWSCLRQSLGQGIEVHKPFAPRMLAESPQDFIGGKGLQTFRPSQSQYLFNSFSLTQRGMQLTLGIARDPNFDRLAYGVLNCFLDHFNGPLAFPILLQPKVAKHQPAGVSDFLEGNTLVSASMPFTRLPAGLEMELRTICIRRNTPPHDIVTNLTLNFEVLRRYRRYLAYPPCHLTPFSIFTPPKEGQLPGGIACRILLWLQDNLTRNRNVLIRVQLHLADEPSAAQRRPWDWAATVMEQMPTSDFLVHNLNDEGFWAAAPPCQIYDEMNLPVPEEEVIDWWDPDNQTTAFLGRGLQSVWYP